ncbi:putative efflux protein, MATE family [Anaerosporobacter mobilis DSM 15930]|jgi:putative MATE family efflux protein|uniref:Probable multidrug resistance protein NorM n=1 Tax=Anaerosporobacter mobilis DSM 15930 TaxID=1120996 RepID=A0A1M7NLM2_9FIRM|nr:MATE family efflux transporter [Anaerosporobacter mobilis]SHN04630.1 putative efflux protein, MATE family [Anaerosporobacter mobilis DSM 15930]
MNSKQEQMKNRPIFPLLVSMAIPMMFSMLIQSLYNIIDSIFVARLGNDALTAVSLVFPLQNLVIAIAVGFGIGVSSCISINLGSKNTKRASQAASVGIILSIVHSILFVIFGLLVTKPFLRMFSSNESIVEMGSEYGYIVLCLSFGCLIQVCIEKIFQSLGEMSITMIVLAVGAIINIILDPILIFGKFGFPAMGVTGAAIATVIGQIAGLILYLIVLAYKKLPIQVSLRNVHINKPLIKQLYSVGVPSSIMMSLPSVLVSILNGMLVRFSEVHVSVLGIYYKLQTFIYLPANGIVQGMRPIVGYNYGAKQKDRLHKTLRVSLLFAAAIMFIGTIVSLFIPQQILGMFDADVSMLEIGVPALRIICLGFLISTFGIIYSGAFEALGMGFQSLTISLLRQFVIIIPLSFLLSRFLGATGIWVSFPISEVIAAIVAIILMRKTLKSI